MSLIRDSVMPCRVSLFALLTCAGFAASAHAQPAPSASDAAKAMVGAWEISNAERDKRCAVTFSVDPAPLGFKLALEAACATAFPALKDVVAWTLGKNDVLRLVDARSAAVVEFTEVENGLYEGERRGEGLLFLQTQAAVKAGTRSAEEMFGDWQVLRELDKPLCRFTLSNQSSGGDGYKLIVKQGCDSSIAGFGLTTWQLDRDQLILTGRGGTWRFEESDPTTWELVPLSTNPLLLLRQ